jgi:hypothetical protein
MAVNDFTVRVSGTVAYSDQSHGSFEAVGKWRGQFGGLVAQHSSTDSLEHFRQLYASNSMGVQQVLDILAESGAPRGVVTLTPNAPTNPKTVTSFVMEVSGLAAFDDNSKAGYIAQWVDGAVNLFPAETADTWNELATVVGAGDQPVDFLTTVFEAVADNASITT